MLSDLLLHASQFGPFGVVLIAISGWYREWRRSKTYLILAAWWCISVIGLALHQPSNQAEGRLKFWIVFGLIGALCIAYGEGIRALKKHRKPVNSPEPKGPFKQVELTRYARHITLREIGGVGQKRLKGAKVLVVGAGGLGAPVLMYLAASGVGVIGVIDDDVVELTNLQRQIIHDEASLGLAKVQSAMLAVRRLNPHVEMRPYRRRMTTEIIDELIADYDLVLDGSDNFDTRYLVNAACVRAGKPLIGGAITQWEGQVSLYDPAREGPCYACIFPERPAPGLVPTCAEAGVAAPLPGVIGAMMAIEAVKHLTGAGAPLLGRLLIHDALNAETRVISAKRRADCAVCGAKAQAATG